MFSFSKKSASGQCIDKVWKTKLACFKGIATEALRSIANNQTPIVFTFFDGDQEDFVKFLDSNKAPYFVLDSGKDASHVNATIFVVRVFLTNSSDVNDFLTHRGKTVPLVPFFLGHYPLISCEDEVLKKWEPRIGQSAKVFCLSMEGSLMEQFGSERIKPLMDSLGLGDDEFVEHSMVSRALTHAREKLEAKVENEIKARTEKEWFQKNINPIK